MKYVIWKINVSTAEVVQMMPVWFPAMHDARAAASALNEQYPASSTGCQYVLKEVYSESTAAHIAGDEGAARARPRPIAPPV
ncbi:MAG: hypothetical protein HZB26_09030 [Candidatus Hydrogenedentes bacterium]|nr:hypothetical protein [Candidatus Hydrogenedentota bacterium]